MQQWQAYNANVKSPNGVILLPGTGCGVALAKRSRASETIVTDGLRSYGAALTEHDIQDKREVERWANNRVENSHLPFRRRERAMLRFRQMQSLQKFASAHANLHNHFNLERRLIDQQTRGR